MLIIIKILGALLLTLIVTYLMMGICIFISALIYHTLYVKIKKTPPPWPPPGYHVLQTFAYSAGQFIGILAGAMVLKSSDLMRFFPLLIGVIVVSCLISLSRSTTRAGGKEQPLTKKDKAANVVSTVVAILASLLFIYPW